MKNRNRYIVRSMKTVGETGECTEWDSIGNFNSKVGALAYANKQLKQGYKVVCIQKANKVHI